jgi:putative membrane-bound dehydrogenase-like protein
MHRLAQITAAIIAVAAFALRSVVAEQSGDSSVAPDVRKPVEPSAALATFALAPGLRLELIAAEPLVRDPMALEFDENGVAYVLEIPRYNEHGKPKPWTPGSIARIEDTDNDGRFDRRTTFADNLTYPTGLFCYRGGLIVGDPPDLLYLRDTDGDGTADQRETWFTGFGSVPAGETQLNSFRWGLDNRIHICTGQDGGDIRPADEPDAPARSVRNRRLLLDPRRRTFELTSGAGQHGMSFDDWGRTYTCDNSNPIKRTLYDDRYLERNPHMSAPSAVADLGPGANFTRLARISPPDAWRAIRDQLRDVGASLTEPHEAGRTSGVFTSATGITIYRGDAWPKRYRGDAFIGEVANNVVYRARIKTGGLDTTSERADAETEFLASTDTWFRPVQFAHGPDGNLYVIDMYRELIEGIEWVPPEVLAQMDATAGNDRGRIYRVVPNGFRQPPPVRLGQLTTEKLVELLAHPNGWQRDTAARLLYERQDKRAVQPLRRLLTESKFPQGRMHALYALDGLNEIDAADVLRGLADDHPRVREHAIRLAERCAANFAGVQERLAEMVDDPNICVRFQLAFSLGELPAVPREPALLELLRRDGDNNWFRVAIQSSLGNGAADFASRILEDETLCESSNGQEFLKTLACQIGRAKREAEIRTLAASIDRLDLDDGPAKQTVKDLVIALLGGGSGASVDQLIAHSRGNVKEVVNSLLLMSRTTALNQNERPESRLEAITILGCCNFVSQRAAFDELLAPQQPQPIQEAVLKILGRFSDAGVGELLLAKWPSMTPAIRATSAELLLSRPAWAESLLQAVERNEVAAADFDPSRVAMLQSHPSPQVRQRAAAVFASAAQRGRAQVVAQYKHALQLVGRVEHGREVFQKTCATCHQLEGKGSAIGADLQAIRDRGAESVMLNILDPNREINPKFLSYVVVTTDGRAITGIITEETPNNLTVRQVDGTPVAITRTEIDEMSSTGLSYMPEGLEKQIDRQSMADLLAYLNSVDGATQPTGNGK